MSNSYFVEHNLVSPAHQIGHTVTNIIARTVLCVTIGVYEALSVACLPAVLQADRFSVYCSLLKMNMILIFKLSKAFFDLNVHVKEEVSSLPVHLILKNKPGCSFMWGITLDRQRKYNTSIKRV